MKRNWPKPLGTANKRMAWATSKRKAQINIYEATPRQARLLAAWLLEYSAWAERKANNG